MIHDRGKRKAKNVGKFPIDNLNPPIQRNTECDAIEAVDQFPEVGLRPGDYFKKPFELFVAGPPRLSFRKALKIVAETSDLPSLCPNIEAEQDDENDETVREFSETASERMY
jgi:hypothetical protein